MANLYQELIPRYQGLMTTPRRGEHRGVSLMGDWLQQQSQDLVRPADFIPGPQQAMAARDLAEARHMTEQAEGLMGKSLGYGLQGLAAVGMLPLMGGVTSPGRKAAKSAIDKQQKRQVLGDLGRRVQQSIDPARGGVVSGSRGPGAAPFTRTALQSRTQRNPAGSLGGIGVARYTPSAEVTDALGGANLSTGGFVELGDTDRARQVFRNKGRTAARLQGDAGKQVDIYDSNDAYKGARLFLSDDGRSGFAIKPDGDIVSVFKHPNTKGAAWGSVATALATQEGGRKLDAFDEFLPSEVYGPVGYEHRAGSQFNDQFAPRGWNYETMGRPYVSAMAYSPGEGNYQYPRAAGNQGLDVPNLFGPEGYGDMIGARDASGLFATDLTPGVSRQLHETIPRMETAPGPTVNIAPGAENFPGVYQSPADIVRQARVVPEDPDLQRYFGVTRRDLDDLTRQAQNESPAGLMVPKAGSAGIHAELIDNPANTERVRDVLALAAAEPRLAGSYGWYYTNPLRQQFEREFGAEEGARRFDQLMQASSVMSANSPVDLELRRASLWQMDPERFINADLSSGEKIFAEYPELFESAEDAGRYAAMYHKGTQVPGLRRLQETGYAFEPQPSKQIKTKNYYESKMGRNYDWPTADAHFVRATGLSDTREMPGAGGSILGPEAETTREWFAGDVAEPLGMKGSPAQALLWNVMAPQTGVKTDVGVPYIEMILRGAKRESERRNVPVDEVLRKFIRGEGLLSRNQVPGLMEGIA